MSILDFSFGMNGAFNHLFLNDTQSKPANQACFLIYVASLLVPNLFLGSFSSNPCSKFIIRGLACAGKLTGQVFICLNT